MLWLQKKGVVEPPSWPSLLTDREATQGHVDIQKKHEKNTSEPFELHRYQHCKNSRDQNQPTNQLTTIEASNSPQNFKQPKPHGFTMMSNHGFWGDFGGLLEPLQRTRARCSGKKIVWSQLEKPGEGTHFVVTKTNKRLVFPVNSLWPFFGWLSVPF